MSNVPPSLSALVSAQKPVVAPAAPVAPPAPVARSFWVGYPTGALQKTEAEVRALAADPTFQIPVTLIGGDNVWTNVDALGLRPVAPPAAPVAPAAPVVPPTPVAPPVVAAAPAAPTPVVTHQGPPSLSASYPPPSSAIQQAPSAMPATIATAEAALAMRNRLLARRDATAPSLADVVSAVQSEGGGSHKHPFATLKEGNWGTSEFVEKAPGGTLVPNGNRDYHAIYIAHRVGATLWKGAGTASKGGAAPLGKFVIGTEDPSDPKYLQMVDRLTRYSRNVQMTSGDDKVVFDDIGRLTPEVQTLAWITDGTWAGYVILVVPGYNSLELQLASCRKAELDELTFQTATFHIETKKEENKGAIRALEALKVRQPPATAAELSKAEARCNWVTNYASLSKCVDPRGVHLKANFDALMANEAASIELMNQVVEFYQGGDFGGGLNNDQILDLFEKYSQKPEPRRGGKK